MRESRDDVYRAISQGNAARPSNRAKARDYARLNPRLTCRRLNRFRAEAVRPFSARTTTSVIRLSLSVLLRFIFALVGRSHIFAMLPYLACRSTSGRYSAASSSLRRLRPLAATPFSLLPRRHQSSPSTSDPLLPHTASDPKKYSHTLLLPKTTLPQRPPVALLRETYGERTMEGLYAWQVRPSSSDWKKTAHPQLLNIDVSKLSRGKTISRERSLSFSMDRPTPTASFIWVRPDRRV